MTVAGWYPDPIGEAPARWFDGNSWTTHVTDEIGDLSAPPPAVPALGDIDGTECGQPVAVAEAAPPPPVGPPVVGLAAPPPYRSLSDVAPTPPHSSASTAASASGGSGWLALGVAAIGLGVAQLLVTVMHDWYSSHYLTTYSALLVAACGIAAAILSNDLQGRAVAGVLVGALIAVTVCEASTSAPVTAVGVGLAIGVAVRATAGGAVLGVVAGLVVLGLGTGLGYGDLTGVVPYPMLGDEAGYLGSKAVILALGPAVLAGLPACARVVGPHGGRAPTAPF